MRNMHSSSSAALALFMGMCMLDAAKGISSRKIMTLFERQSDDGPRHSPLFNLPVGEGNFPRKMVLFNNDIYNDGEDLLAADKNGIVGYDQGHCVETIASEGFLAECFYTFVIENKGSFTANGPFLFDAKEGMLPSELAITGGTGDYKGASGEVEVRAGPAEDFPSLRFDVSLESTRGGGRKGGIQRPGGPPGDGDSDSDEGGEGGKDDGEGGKGDGEGGQGGKGGQGSEGSKGSEGGRGGGEGGRGGGEGGRGGGGKGGDAGEGDSPSRGGGGK